MIVPYDEGRTRQLVEAMSAAHRVAFAAACAEQLFPLYRWFAVRTGQGQPSVLRSSLDLVWSLDAPGAGSRGRVEEARRRSEELVPHDEDEDWSLTSPLAQNAAACVSYALRAWLSEDPQEAVWAARQLVEAADYIVQLGGPTHTYTDEAEGRSPVVLVQHGIESALAGAASGPDESCREARLRGEHLCELVEDVLG